MIFVSFKTRAGFPIKKVIIKFLVIIKSKKIFNFHPHSLSLNKFFFTNKL